VVKISASGISTEKWMSGLGGKMTTQASLIQILVDSITMKYQQIYWSKERNKTEVIQILRAIADELEKGGEKKE